MLTDNKIKEEINLAYVLAVAAMKGFSTEITRVDADSVDATIQFNGKLNDDSTLYSPEIKLQLKATSNANINGDNIHFALPIKNYNDLKARTATPRLLVILCLPEVKEDWLQHTANELVLKKCAYFLNLKGLPDSNNDTTVTVHVPLANVFSPDALFDLMLKTSKEEML